MERSAGVFLGLGFIGFSDLVLNGELARIKTNTLMRALDPLSLLSKTAHPHNLKYSQHVVIWQNGMKGFVYYGQEIINAHGTCRGVHGKV